MGEPLIKWKRGKKSEHRYLHSADERFEIVPIYRSTVNPSGYWLEDHSKKDKRGRAHRSSFETVKRAKEHAEWLVREERGLNPPGIVITDDML